MSKYRVHECDWCKARSETVVANADQERATWTPPDGWREIDDRAPAKQLLCVDCLAGRDAAIAQVRTDRATPRKATLA